MLHEVHSWPGTHSWWQITLLQIKGSPPRFMSIAWKNSLAFLVPLAKSWRVPKDRALPGTEKDIPSGPPWSNAPAGYSQLRVAAHRPANQSNSITGARWFAGKHNVCSYLLRWSKINPCHQWEKSKSQPKHIQRQQLHPGSISSVSLLTEITCLSTEFSVKPCQKKGLA